jgi:hypothetical protein
LKHIISFSHTDLRNSPSANFLIIPFEIFQEHTLRTLLGKMSKGVRIEWLSKKKYVSREKCNGDDVIVFYKKWLNPYFVIM